MTNSDGAPTDVTPQLATNDVIDSQRLSLPLCLLYGALAILVLLEGFDAQLIGFAAPAISEEWGLNPSSLAAIFGAGLFGMALGALAISPLSDWVGRRPVLIASSIYFGLFVLATALCTDPSELIAARFLTGFALGAVFPNVLALTAEYTPARLRSIAVMLMAGCFTLGAAMGGLCAASMIPTWGWRSVFVVGGVAPLVAGLALPIFVPESVKFLTLRGRLEKAQAAVRRIFPKSSPALATSITLAHRADKSAPLSHLFKDTRAISTGLIWLVSFMNLLELYFLSNWLPTLLRARHVAASEALLASSLLQIGGTLGTLLLAVLVARVRLLWLLAGNFAIAALAIAAIGISGTTAFGLLGPIFVAGFCVGGGQPGNNAFNAEFYPTFIRASGVGWAQGIGRFGSIVGSLVGGVFLSLHLNFQIVFAVMALPSVLTVLALFGLLFTTAEPKRGEELARAPSARRKF